MKSSSSKNELKSRSSSTSQPNTSPKRGKISLWLFASNVLTFLIPNFVLSWCGGMPNAQVQRAWREKVALCMLIAFFCFLLAFITYGMTMIICVPPKKAIYRTKMLQKANDDKNRWFVIHGKIYNLPEIYKPYKHKLGFDPYKLFATMDISPYFNIDNPKCAGKNLQCKMGDTNAPSHCHQASLVNDLEYIADLALNWQDVTSTPGVKSKTKFVFNGQVYDIGAYLSQVKPSSSSKPYGNPADTILRQIIGTDGTKALSTLPKDILDCIISRHRAGYLEVKTLGCMATDVVLYLSLVVILTVVLTKFFLAVGFAFSMARRLGKIPSRNNLNNHHEAELKKLNRTVSKTNLNLNENKINTSRFSICQKRIKLNSDDFLHQNNNKNSQSNINSYKCMLDSTNSKDHMYCILLVTCYSEDEKGIKTTLDSLAGTDYDDKQKLLFVVADGLITGSGNKKSTPDILISMLEKSNVDNSPADWAGSELFEPYYFDNNGLPLKHSYLALADGEKRHNQAMVYAGYYKCQTPVDANEAKKLEKILSNTELEERTNLEAYKRYQKKESKKKRQKFEDISNDEAEFFKNIESQNDDGVDFTPEAYNNLYDPNFKLNFYKKEQEHAENPFSEIEMIEHRVPMIIVVKCGTAAEANKPKPGNRGKRDSQIILLSFLSKCLFDDRMTSLDFDLFYKISRLTGVTPDHYELLMMVDADTKVDQNALMSLVLAMKSDHQIMGLCGETQIQNKSASWVTAIQIFEYYISHHLNKAFESIFGGVTCLPGCFCMYRIKAPKGSTGSWVPIIASPDIVDAYSEFITETLHKKNLLLLGEDRYLTTLMLKTFPRRKLLFVPQATCQTFVPETFSVLLSQRRRWINSTIHNLFELILVPDLCGIFCCSMQFVIFMELAGTLVLPAAISFTIVLIVSTFVTTPQWIPLFLLAAILGLPALLILFTTSKPEYIYWFLVYILALPIWNFVLPMYAFWHFDDFSWGETRKLDDKLKGKDDHGTANGKFDPSQICMKKWIEFELERRSKVESYLSAMHGIIKNYSKTSF